MGTKNLTLDADTLGIWLIENTKKGPKQLGHISWHRIYKEMQFCEKRAKILDDLMKDEGDL
jgi:hypothetical protein